MYAVVHSACEEIGPRAFWDISARHYLITNGVEPEQVIPPGLVPL